MRERGFGLKTDCSVVTERCAVSTPVFAVAERSGAQPAMANMMHFKPVAFHYEKVHMSGGHLQKGMPMVTKKVNDQTFVKMATSETWLIAATTGCSRYSGSSFGRTSLLEALHDEVQSLCDKPGVEPEPGAGEGADYDPMEEVEGDTSQTSPKPNKTRGQKRAYYHANHCARKVVCLDVAARCPKEDPTGAEKRTITLYVENRKQIWLAIEDVDWAVEYLYRQNQLKGVPLIDDDCTGPSGDVDDSTCAGDTQSADTQ